MGNSTHLSPEAKKAVDAFLWKRLIVGALLFGIANIGALVGVWAWLQRGIDTAVLSEAKRIVETRVEQKLDPAIRDGLSKLDRRVGETERRASAAQALLDSFFQDRITPMIEQFGELRYRGDQVQKELQNLEAEAKSATDLARGQIEEGIKAPLELMATQSERLETITRQIDVLQEEGLTTAEVQSGIHKLRDFLEMINEEAGQNLLLEIQESLDDLLKRTKALEMGIRAITDVVVRTPEKDRPKIDFTIVDGAVALHNHTAGSVQLSETTLTRTGGDIVISCLATAPHRDTRIVFHTGSATTADGTTFRIGFVNVGRTSYEATSLATVTNLRPEIPVSVQWKTKVPVHHRLFSEIELNVTTESVLTSEMVQSRIFYRNVAVPATETP